ncbi:MAG: MscS family membrane protein, partial [Cyclobacteriaceae bacterium]
MKVIWKQNYRKDLEITFATQSIFCMSKTIYFSFLILVPILLFGQEESEVVLSSPYQSIRTHLYYLQADQENPALAAAPFVKHAKNLKAAQSAAIKLKQVLDGSGIYMDMSVIPTNINYYDSTLMSPQYRLSPIYPEILLVKEGNEWVYPLSSIAAITDAHSELFIWGTDRLLGLLPSSGTRMIFGLYVYQYIGIFVLVLISTIVHFLFSLFFNRLFVRMIKRAGYTTLAEGFLLPIARPASMFVVLSIALVFVPIIQLPPSLTKYALLGLKALIPLFGTVVFYRLINILALYLHRIAEKTQSSLD